MDCNLNTGWIRIAIRASKKRTTCMGQFHLVQWSILVVYWHAFHWIERWVSTINHFPKDSVFAIKMRLLCVSDEKLRLVGVCDIAWVGHRNNPSGIKLQSGSGHEWARAWTTYFQSWPYFVWKSSDPNTLASFAGTGGIASLYNETTDVTMKNAVIKISWCAECEEVLLNSEMDYGWQDCH